MLLSAVTVDVESVCSFVCSLDDDCPEVVTRRWLLCLLIELMRTGAVVVVVVTAGVVSELRVRDEPLLVLSVRGLRIGLTRAGTGVVVVVTTGVV